MQTNNHSSIKSKAKAVDSIMGHPVLSMAIHDSWDAPPGSTKKSKARGILKSLHKPAEHLFNDGQGGGDSWLNPQTSPPSIMSFLNPFSWLQPKSAEQTHPFTTTQTGAPLYSSYTTPTINFIKSVDHLMPKNSGVTSSPTKENTLKAYDQSGKVVYVKPGVRIPGISLTPKTGGSFIGPDGNLHIIPAGLTQADVEKTLKLMPMDRKSSTISGKSSQVGPPAPVANKNFTPVSTTSYSAPIGPTPDQIDTGSAIYKQMQGMQEANGGDYLDQWFGSLGKSDQDHYREIYQAVKSGMGPTTWTYKVLGDKNLLSKYTGLSKDELGFLPASGLLSDQLTNIRKLVNDANHIDSQLDSLVKMQNAGYTVQQDLTSFIRGKDQYLGQIDKMLDDVNSQMNNIDMSNPIVAQRMGNYVNYLTILKGRQNQRYVGYLNTGINDFNAQLAAKENLYKTSLDRAEQEYNSAAAGATEGYTRLTNVLSEMYTNVQERTTMAQQQEQYQLQKLQTLADIDYKGALATKAKADAANGGESGKFTGYKNYMELIGYNENDKGEIINPGNANFLDALNAASSANYNLDLMSNAFSQVTQKVIKSDTSTGTFMGNIGKYGDNLATLAEQMDSITTDPNKVSSLSADKQAQYKTLSDYYNKISNSIMTGASDGIRAYLSSDKAKIQSVKDAIKTLVGAGGFWSRSPVPPTEAGKSHFLATYGAKLGDIAELLFNYYTIGLKKGVGIGDIFATDKGQLYNADDNTIINILSSELGGATTYYYDPSQKYA